MFKLNQGVRYCLDGFDRVALDLTPPLYEAVDAVTKVLKDVELSRQLDVLLHLQLLFLAYNSFSEGITIVDACIQPT